MLRSLGLQNTLIALKEKTDGTAESIVALLGNRRALPAFFALAGRNAADAAERIDRVKNSVGAADEAYGKVAGVMAWKQAMQSAHNVLIRFGQSITDGLAPSLRSLASILSGIAESSAFEARLAAISERLQKVAEAAGKVAKIMTFGDDDQRGKLLTALGTVFKSMLSDAANAAGQVLLRLAPLIGSLIGKGYKQIATGVEDTPGAFKRASDRSVERTGMQIRCETDITSKASKAMFEQEMKQAEITNLRAQGDALAADLKTGAAGGSMKLFAEAVADIAKGVKIPVGLQGFDPLKLDRSGATSTAGGGAGIGGAGDGIGDKVAAAYKASNLTDIFNAAFGDAISTGKAPTGTKSDPLFIEITGKVVEFDDGFITQRG